MNESNRSDRTGGFRCGRSALQFPSCQRGARRDGFGAEPRGQQSGGAARHSPAQPHHAQCFTDRCGSEAVRATVARLRGDIGSALDGLNQVRDTPLGTGRINAPNSIAAFIFAPVMSALVSKNPNLELEIVATDRLVDIVEEGFDASIRLGEHLRDGMTAVKIKPRLRLAVVGSPAYLARYGTPRTPADLKDHVCIRNIYPSGVAYAWEFSRAGKIIAFEPTGPLSLDDHELMVEAARSGVALAYAWEHRALPLLKSGKLIEVLASWTAPEDWLYLYYPTRKFISAGLRALIEALRAGPVDQGLRSCAARRQ